MWKKNNQLDYHFLKFDYIHESHNKTASRLLRTGKHEAFQFYLQTICTVLKIIFAQVNRYRLKYVDLPEVTYLYISYISDASPCKWAGTKVRSQHGSRVMLIISWKIPSYLSRSNSNSSEFTPCHKISI